MAESSTSALTAAEERKRALIDAAAALLVTILLWPFPIARALLTPFANVALLLASWMLINVIYHVACARVWRRTAAMYLLDHSLCLAASGEYFRTVDDRTALRWGAAAGALVIVNACWAGIRPFIHNVSGAALCRCSGQG